MSQHLGVMGQKLTNLTSSVSAIREKMQIAYNGLRKRLDHSIEVQDDMKAELGEVHQTIEDVKEDTEKVCLVLCVGVFNHPAFSRAATRGSSRRLT